MKSPRPGCSWCGAKQVPGTSCVLVVLGICPQQGLYLMDTDDGVHVSCVSVQGLLAYVCVMLTHPHAGADQEAYM